MKVDEILRTGLSRLDVIKVRTAVNPLLWLVGLVTPLGVIVLLLSDDRIVRFAMIGIIALPIILLAIAYFLLLFRDPDRLQSEEFRIRQRALQILYKKGGTTEIVEVANQRPRLEIERRDKREPEE